MDLTVLAADDLRRDYAADCRLRGLADGSVVRTLRELRTIERDLGKLPSELTRAEYRSWLAGFDANSANFRLRCTRGFYSWLHREGLRDEPIGQGIRIRAIEEPQTTATDEQVREMVESSKRSARDHAIVTLLVATGARRSEVGLMNFGDLAEFVDSGCVRISRSKTQSRIAMIDQAAERAVRKWLREVRRRRPSISPSDPAWLVANGPQLVGRAVGRHSGDELSPHAIRRWFVTTVARRGMSSASIGRQLGWSAGTTNIMIGIYTKATASDLLTDEYRRLMR